tara:strand:- start:109 stop:573 length:465 start_codon:yes stop_codon:yes gene_type:complete
MREDELREWTFKILARLNEPRAIKGNPEAIEDEAWFICKRIKALAPTQGYRDWFDDFEEALLMSLETRSWPTAKQIGEAARQIAPKRQQLIDDTQPKGYEPDELKINADRIKNNQGVGESYITGTFAKQMVRNGLVTEEELEPYIKYLNHWKNN